MPNADVYLDATVQPFPADWRKRKQSATQKLLAIAGFPGGMQSGRPSLFLVAELNDHDKTLVFIETSLDLMMTAMAGFKGKYGEKDGPSEVTYGDVRQALQVFEAFIVNFPIGDLRSLVAEGESIMGKNTAKDSMGKPFDHYTRRARVILDFLGDMQRLEEELRELPNE